MTTTDQQLHTYERDAELRARAASVLPGGMYGHQSAARLPDGFPQFFARGEGSHIWDVDGNEYIDYMCSYGPIVLGHRHPSVERAVAAQAADGDCFNAPTERIVELAELMTGLIGHGDWAWFAKNGSDATRFALQVARAHTGKNTAIRGEHAYHGWGSTWMGAAAGMTPSATDFQLTYTYHDLESVRAAAVEAGDDLAAVVVSAVEYDASGSWTAPDQAFVRGVRDLCDATGAVLVLDDVRAGFRLDLGGSWASYGVEPDISAYCKAIANGYPLSAVVAKRELEEAASRFFATGSYWFSGVAMAASIATITTLQETDGVAQIKRAGTMLREGLNLQAQSHGIAIKQAGPVQVPSVRFVGDDLAKMDIPRAMMFTGEAAKRGVYLHPTHNWFLSAAHRDEDIEHTLAVTDVAFARVKEAFGDA
jgi:glutamate-1-semialdehyde 2,1-aminomutase